MRTRLAKLAAILALAVFVVASGGGPSATAREVDLTPVWMTIPVINVNAPIEVVGWDEQGLTMALPSSGSSIAWFNASSLPGTFGNAIMAGHVDYIRDVAVFWNLNKLVPGDYVNVFTKDGSQFIYAVDTSTWYDDKAAPVDQIFAWSEEPIVTLITCGGTFDPSTRNYDKRLVVVAKATWDWRSQLPSSQPAQPSPSPDQQPPAAPASPDPQPTPPAGG